jgi:exopolysaccharide biosynthesis operon protein EpsL
MVRSYWHLLASVPLLGAVVGQAHAQIHETLNLRAGVSVLNNNNFFRTSTSAVSERVTSQSIGVNVAIPYSLQRFELDASLVGNQHQTNSNFDFTAQNYNAAWRWSLTPRFQGSLTSARSETLNATTDSVDPNQRNRSTVQNSGLSAAYDLGGPWQLTGGVSTTSTTNERAVLGQSDNRSSGVNAGVRYVPSTGNSIDYSLQEARGSSTNDYKSTAHAFSAVWILSGNTTVNGRIVHSQQKFNITPQYDFSGTGGAFSLLWRLTGKTTLTASWQRDLASYQTAGTTHTKTDAVTLSPSWQISPKSSVRLQYRNATRDDQGNPTGTPSNRQDSIKDLSATYSWLPRPSATLAATISDTTNSSGVAAANYNVQQLTLSAQFAF